MQELNMAEVSAVSGGFWPIIIIIGAIILSGCGDNAAKDKEGKNKKKIDEEIEKAGG